MQIQERASSSRTDSWLAYRHSPPINPIWMSMKRKEERGREGSGKMRIEDRKNETPEPR
jgi:hypothetical protein